MRATLAPAEGVTVGLPLPDGATPRPAAPFDAAAAPGVSLAAAQGWSAGGLSLDVACARAPAWMWTPGMTGPALAGASAAVHKSLALSALEPGVAVARDGRIEQPFSGRGAGFAVTGRHVLGASRRGLLLCTAACSEPEEGASCAAFVDGLEVNGLSPLPEAGLLASALELGLDHPRAAAGWLGAMLLALAAWIVARRPRPRR